MSEDQRDRVLDVTEEHPPGWAVLDAAEVLRAAQETGGALPWRRRVDAPPVLRFTDRYLVGQLDLRAREFGFLLEFQRCRFAEPPDVRQAKIAGCTFDGCWLPGLDARNLRSDNDIVLRECTVAGEPIDLTDADLNGTLTLAGSSLEHPTGAALLAERLVLGGALIADNVTVTGQLRLSGMRSGGNVNLRGAALRASGDGVAMEARGMQVSGSLLCATDPESQHCFRSTGTLLLTNTQLDGDLVLGGAHLRTPDIAGTPADEPDSRFDAAAALVGDRMRVGSNVSLGEVSSNGTLRMVNAQVGGSLVLDRAEVDVSGGAAPPLRRKALRLDGSQVDGDLRGWQARITGQLRLVDLTVRGTTMLDRARIRNPRAEAIHARRLTVGGNLDCKSARIAGSVLLQGATIGANLDLRASMLTAPGSYTRDGSQKPSLNIRAVTIGRDLTCAAGRRPFRADGEVRMHSSSVVREANFTGAELGAGTLDTALNAYGAAMQDLDLRLARPPVGRVNMQYAGCASLADNEHFWTGWSGVDLDGFRYNALADPVSLTDDARVGTRLRWLRGALRHEYVPGPYDQLAAMFRASGNEEHAATVLIAKQQDRYRALGRGYRVLGPGVWLWSSVQRLMVGYGYRPTRALVWLLGLLVFGSLWFGLVPDDCAAQRDLVANGPRCSINVDDTGLVWNPFLYTMDLLVPIVDFGNKSRWYMAGADQWISAAMIATGWILATTVAAGVTRSLRGGESRP